MSRLSDLARLNLVAVQLGIEAKRLGAPDEVVLRHLRGLVAWTREETEKIKPKPVPKTA